MERDAEHGQSCPRIIGRVSAPIRESSTIDSTRFQQSRAKELAIQQIVIRRDLVRPRGPIVTPRQACRGPAGDPNAATTSEGYDRQATTKSERDQTDSTVEVSEMLDETDRRSKRTGCISSPSSIRPTSINNYRRKGKGSPRSTSTGARRLGVRHQGQMPVILFCNDPKLLVKFKRGK